LIRELRPKYPKLPVIRMCELLEVPRSLVYRKPNDRPERTRFYRELTFEIASVLGVHPGYGYRRVRRQLARQGVDCGYKSVARAMKEGGLQRKRKRVQPKTSDGKGRGNYPNLLDGAVIDAPGQVWVADITYIGLPGGFAYLACVLDVFLRKIVGRAMSMRIDGKLTLEALKDALAKMTPAPGWIHHSDRGSQYLSEDYVKLVLAAGGRISCSDKASPEDNAFMESFFKTLKVEEVWLEEYENFSHADQSINKFIGYYNAERMHSSLNYMSPQEFEQWLKKNDQS
jgi:transposase InsO family protein